jgi:D-arabinose 1-dehydrogenase-like Zn-dependent alcohol dehydrogenase
MGYRCVGIDTRPEPIALVESFRPKFKPDIILDAKNGHENAAARILSAFDGQEIDAAIVCTDALPAFEFSTNILKKHGKLVVVGQPKEPIPFHWSVFVAKDITIVPGGVGEKPVMEEMMDLVVKEGIRAKYKTYKLKDISRLVKDFHKPDMCGKLILEIE